MRTAIDLRSLMETGGKISGIENYSVNAFNYFANNKDFFGIYNSYKHVTFPKALNRNGEIKATVVPNKILNLTLSIFNFPKFENLYGSFDLLWMPDLRPYALHPKTKMALTVHDLSPVLHPEYYSFKRRIWHKLIHYQKSFERADIIFAVSKYTKYDLIKVFGLPESKIKVIYPGIDHEIFHVNLDTRIKHKIREKYDLPEKYILSLSTIEPRKNIIGIIKAFESLFEDDVHLVIAGRPGWLYNDVLDAVSMSPKRNQIRILGYIEEPDKPYLISLANMLCYPSFYEGFGFQPLEAMACGVPVITSARTSMPEICADAALIVEPYHTDEIAFAMRELLQNQETRSKLIAKGLERVKHFSWKNTFEQISQALINI